MHDSVLIAGFPCTQLQKISEKFGINVVKGNSSLMSDAVGSDFLSVISQSEMDYLVKNTSLGLEELAQNDEIHFLLFYQTPCD